MTLNWGAVVQGVLGGLITAGIIGALVWGSQGGLVHVLGGITSKEVEDLVKKRLPNGVIVGFDLPDGCPVGWVVVYKDVFDPSYSIYTPDIRNIAPGRSKNKTKPGAVTAFDSPPTISYCKRVTE